MKNKLKTPVIKPTSPSPRGKGGQTQNYHSTLNWVKALILFVFFLFTFPLTSLAALTSTEDLMKIGAGARPMGMGKAFVAVADDGNAVFFNPAGLASLKAWQVTSMYTSLFDGDLPYIVATGSMPLTYGNLGAGFISTGTGGIASPSPTGITYFDYYDRLGFLSYALNAEKELGWKDVLLGGNLKLFSKGFTGSTDGSGTGVDADFGILYTPNSSWSFGADLQNFLPTTLQWTSGAQEDIPALLKVGAADKLLDQKLLLALDMDLSVDRTLPIPFHFGAEYRVSQNLSLRAGLDQNISASSKIATNPTAGVGINYRGFEINYAYHPYVDSSSSVAHFISISYAAPLPEAAAQVQPEKVFIPKPKITSPPKISKPKAPVKPAAKAKPKPKVAHKKPKTSAKNG